MNTSHHAPLRLGAIRHPGEPADRFALAEVISRRNPRAAALLAEVAR